jgi:Fe-S cluster assembly ATP-binding protein
VSLTFEAGKNYLVLGKNGSGKSSLSSFLMGNPAFEYVSGEVQIDGKNLLEMTSDERSKAGLFLSFQNVPEIEGINLRDYLRTIYNSMLKSRFPETPPLTPFVFKRFMKKHLDELQIPENFLERDLNVGFSG